VSCSADRATSRKVAGSISNRNEYQVKLLGG